MKGFALTILFAAAALAAPTVSESVQAKDVEARSAPEAAASLDKRGDWGGYGYGSWDYCYTESCWDSCWDYYFGSHWRHGHGRDGRHFLGHHGYGHGHGHGHGHHRGH